jgi:hypothetical protein
VPTHWSCSITDFKVTRVFVRDYEVGGLHAGAEGVWLVGGERLATHPGVDGRETFVGLLSVRLELSALFWLGHEGPRHSTYALVWEADSPRLPILNFNMPTTLYPRVLEKGSRFFLFHLFSVDITTTKLNYIVKTTWRGSQ